MNHIWHSIVNKKIDCLASEELVAILEETLAFLSNSDDSPWSDMEVKKVVITIKKSISTLKQSNKAKVAKIEYLFLPTAPLQEIAMENGWVDEYLLLAERYDDVSGKHF